MMERPGYWISRTFAQLGTLAGRAVLSVGLLSALAPMAAAHLPEYFGRRYVLVAPEPDKPPAPPCAGENRGELMSRADAMRDALQSQQLGSGAYGPELADPLGELGGLYAEVCNHPAALKSFREAIKRLRVNDGLLTPAQIPYLKTQAESYQAIGDFRSAQMNYRYIFRIHGMGRGAMTERAWQDSLAYFAKAREIFIHPSRAGDIDLFFQAFTDNESMLYVQGERDDVSYADYKSLVLSQLYNLYVLLGTEEVRLRPNGPASPSAASRLVSGESTLAYSKGIKLLEETLDRASDQAPVQRGELWFRLGNWHQWNGNWRRACRAYAQAWPLTEDEGGLALREQMQQPAELPEDPALWASLVSADVPVRAVVDARFRVSRRGDINALDTQRVDEGSSALAGTVHRWLRDSHARPAIAEGACVDAELTGRRYRLLD